VVSSVSKGEKAAQHIGNQHLEIMLESSAARWESALLVEGRKQRSTLGISMHVSK